MKKANLDSEFDSLVLDEISSATFEKPQTDKDVLNKEAIFENLDYGITKTLDFSVEREPKSVFSNKNKTLIAHTIPVADLMIFELSADHSALKVQWSSLAPRLKEVFEEIIYSLPVEPSSDRNDDGCYTFSYSDDDYNLSVVSIVINGKAALFYKNVESPEC